MRVCMSEWNLSNVKLETRDMLNIGIYFGEVFFDEKKEFCIFIGSFCLVSCGTSLFKIKKEVSVQSSMTN